MSKTPLSSNDPTEPSRAGSNQLPASIEKPSPPPQIDFEFLNFSHPSDAKASRARRKVRSHVTRQQHQREHLAAAAARRSQSLPQPSGSNTSRPAALATHHTISIPPDTATPSDISPALTLRSAPASAVTSTAASPMQTPTVQRRIDPFETFPFEWRSSLAAVMDHYVNHVATPNSYLDAGADRSLLRQVWVPFVNSDAVLTSAVVLLSAAHMSKVHGSDSHNIDTITLRGMVIRGINDSLHSPEKSLSDALLGTIVTMASFEAIFGDSQAYGMHMSGLQKLVEIRGGLPTLGLNGLLERIVLYTDCNAGFILGYDSFFPPSHWSTRNPRPEPEPSQYSLRHDSVAYPHR